MNTLNIHFNVNIPNRPLGINLFVKEIVLKHLRKDIIIRVKNNDFDYITISNRIFVQDMPTVFSKAEGKDIENHDWKEISEDEINLLHSTLFQKFKIEKLILETDMEFKYPLVIRNLSLCFSGTNRAALIEDKNPEISIIENKEITNIAMFRKMFASNLSFLNISYSLQDMYPEWCKETYVSNIYNQGILKNESVEDFLKIFEK